MIETKNNLNSQEFKKAPKISINNLSFRYPNAKKDTLKNIYLEINSGEKIGIVGYNGRGKSTLVKILCKIYPTKKRRHSYRR